MDKFRKKPAVIEAIQFRAANKATHENVNFSTPDPEKEPYVVGKHWIQTLEGPLIVSDGDWIIKGVKGEFYPCKPDIFDATYERVN